MYKLQKQKSAKINLRITSKPHALFQTLTSLPTLTRRGVGGGGGGGGGAEKHKTVCNLTLIGEGDERRET